MKKCMNCGAENKSTAKLCKECGDPLNKQSGASMSMLQRITTPFAILRVKKGTVVEFDKSNKKPLHKRIMTLLTTAICFVLAIFIASLGFRAYNFLGLGANAQKNIPVLYLQHGTALKYSSPLLETPISIRENFSPFAGYDLSEYIKLSHDGTILAYMSNNPQSSSNLYKKDTVGFLNFFSNYEHEEIALAEDVAIGQFAFLSDNRLLFITTDGFLFLNSGNRSTSYHTENASEIIAVTENDVAYYTAEQGDTTALYMLDFTDKNATPVLVDEDMSDIYSINDNGDVIYSSHSGDNNNPYQVKKYNGTVTVLAEKAYQVLDTAENGSIFYLTQNSSDTTIDPATFFNDNLKVADSALTQPVEADYMVEKKNFWGATYTELDEEAYEEAQEAYAQKEMRDEVRELLLTAYDSEPLFTLYHTTGTGFTVLDDEISAGSAVANANLNSAVYSKSRPINNTLDFSDITTVEQATEHITASLSSNLFDYHYTVLGQGATIFATHNDSTFIHPVIINDDGIYYRQEDKDVSLYFASISQGTLSTPKKLAEINTLYTNIMYKDELIYSTANGDGTYEIYRLDGEKSTRITDDTQTDQAIFTEENYVLYYTDYDNITSSGELNIYTGSSKTIGSGVTDYSYRLDNYIYFLGDYNSTQDVGKLYLYDGKQQLIDEYVTAVVK